MRNKQKLNLLDNPGDVNENSLKQDSFTTKDSSNKIGLFNLNNNLLNTNISGFTKHCTPPSQEWKDTVYFYNKSSSKPLPSAYNAMDDYIKSYFTIQEKLKGKKHTFINAKTNVLSLNKIMVSSPEIKHSNNKVVVTVYTHNKKKDIILYNLRKLYKSLTINLAKREEKKLSLKKRSFLIRKDNKIFSRKKVINSIRNLALKSSFLALNTPNTKANFYGLTKGTFKVKSGSLNLDFNMLVYDIISSSSTGYSSNYNIINKAKLYKSKNFKVYSKPGIYPLHSSILNCYNLTNYYQEKSNTMLDHVLPFMLSAGNKRYLQDDKKFSLANKKKVSYNKKRLLQIKKIFKSNKTILNRDYFNAITLNNIKSFITKISNKNIRLAYKTLIGNNITAPYNNNFYYTKKNTNSGIVKLKVLANNTSKLYSLIKLKKHPFLLSGVKDLLSKKKKYYRSKTHISQSRSLFKLFSIHLDNSIYNLFKAEANTNILWSYKNVYMYLTHMKLLLKKHKTTILNKKILRTCKKSLAIMKNAEYYKEHLSKDLNLNLLAFKLLKKNYYIRYLSNFLVKESLFMYYVRSLYVNNNLYKSGFLLGISKIISKIYNKKLEFNFVNLKYIHLNSDILTYSIANRIKNRKNRLNRILDKSMNLVKLPKQNKPSGSSQIIKKKLSSSFLKSLSSPLAFKRNNKDIFNNLIKNLYGKILISTFENNKIKRLQENTLDTLNHKAVFGVRLEARGRLGVRLTASRSVFKLRSKGNLKHKGFSNFLPYQKLKGTTKPNIQYQVTNTKTRNGSFGLRGWISSN